MDRRESRRAVRSVGAWGGCGHVCGMLETPNWSGCSSGCSRSFTGIWPSYNVNGATSPIRVKLQQKFYGYLAFVGDPEMAPDNNPRGAGPAPGHTAAQTQLPDSRERRGSGLRPLDAPHADVAQAGAGVGALAAYWQAILTFSCIVLVTPEPGVDFPGVNWYRPSR
jgi:hypothetical protein